MLCCLLLLCTDFVKVITTLGSMEEDAFQKEKDFSLQTLSPPELRGRARAGLSARDHFCAINSTEPQSNPPQW